MCTVKCKTEHQSPAVDSIRVSRRRACRNLVYGDKRKELNFNVEIYRLSLGDNDEPCLHRRGSRMGGDDVTQRSREARRTAKSLRLLSHVNTMLPRVKPTDRLCGTMCCWLICLFLILSPAYSSLLHHLYMYTARENDGRHWCYSTGRFCSCSSGDDDTPAERRWRTDRKIYQPLCDFSGQSQITRPPVAVQCGSTLALRTSEAHELIIKSHVEL